ncbi:hypothetical protein D3C73_278220 [compost metagenome]
MGAEVLQHRIQYTWFDGNDERIMDEGNHEYLHGMIEEGYSEGELYQLDEEMNTDVRGWWRIIY